MFGIQVDFSEMVTITYIVLAGEFNDGEGTRFTQKFRVEYQRTEQGPWISYISPVTGQVCVLSQPSREYDSLVFDIRKMEDNSHTLQLDIIYFTAEMR